MYLFPDFIEQSMYVSFTSHANLYAFLQGHFTQDNGLFL